MNECLDLGIQVKDIDGHFEKRFSNVNVQSNKNESKTDLNEGLYAISLSRMTL